MSMLIIMLKLCRLTEDAQNHFLKALQTKDSGRVRQYALVPAFRQVGGQEHGLWQPASSS